MSLPPNDVPASELFLKLLEPRPSEVIDFPRKDRFGQPIGKIRIQVLTMEDHNRARLAAQQSLKRSVAGFGIEGLDQRDMESPAVREVLGDLVAHEILCMACLSDKPSVDNPPEPTATYSEKYGVVANSSPYARVFKTPSDLRKVLTADETLTLFRAYQLVQNKWGPFERTTGMDGELEAWVKRLEEGAREFPLLALSLPQLHDLTSSLAARISLLSRVLVSQWSSLPDTLASALEPYCLGTGFSGALVDEYIRISKESSPDVSTEQAARMAESEKNELPE